MNRKTNFTRHFISVQQHHSRPKNFYKMLISTLISQATNLGVVAMSASADDVTVDMLRNVLQFYVREETITAVSVEIVNQHNQLPFSEIHGSGQVSFSDAQGFRIRAKGLLIPGTTATIRKRSASVPMCPISTPCTAPKLFPATREKRFTSLIDFWKTTLS